MFRMHQEGQYHNRYSYREWVSTKILVSVKDTIKTMSILCIKIYLPLPKNPLFYASARQIIAEDKVLTIKVKPGWRKGTKITFEGMGNEIHGMYPADVIFVVAEKQHPSFRREGDDIHLEVEIPLVEALTGCTLAVPLLEGQVMSMEIDDVIYPGYEKIIEGQGMPSHNDPKTRGNLIIKFSVEFPKELTEEQRSNIVDILHDTR